MKETAKRMRSGKPIVVLDVTRIFHAAMRKIMHNQVTSETMQV